MRTGRVYVYNQNVDHKVLAFALRRRRENLVCVFNKDVSRFQFAKFMEGEYANAYNTFITKQDEFLTITLLDKKTRLVANKFLVKSREPGYELEFKLPMLEYYTKKQTIINRKLNIFDGSFSMDQI